MKNSDTRLVFILFLAGILMLAVSCKNKKTTPEIAATPVEVVVQQPEQTSDRDTFLYYQRGACYGMCPIFNLTVYQSGKAIYEGKNFVDNIGLYQTQINLTALNKIKDLADQIGYFSLQDEYDNPHVTDLPTTVTVISDGKNLKKVSNRYKGPGALKLLYNELDSLIVRQTWKGTGE